MTVRMEGRGDAMNKTACWLVLAGLIIACGRAGAESPRFAEASPRDRATWQLAVHTAARRALEAAEGLKTPDAERLSLMQSALTEAILGDRVAHGRRDASRDLCLALARTRLKEAFDASLGLVLEVANEQSPLKVQAADVQRILGDRQEQSLAAAQAAFEKSQFEPLFERVRSQAVALDRQAADRRASPPPYEALDGVLTGLAGKEGLLAEPWPAAAVSNLLVWLQPFAGRQDGPLLEEVSAYADGVAARMADGVRRQVALRMETVDTLAGGEALKDLRLASAIEGAVLEELGRNTNGVAGVADAGGALPVYPLFSVVRQYAHQKAIALEAERFGAFLQATPLLEISSGYLEDAIETNTMAHIKTGESRQLFIGALTALKRPAVAAGYGGGKKTPATTHFAKLLAGGTSPAAVFEKRIADGLDALLPTVRGALADAQYALAFSTLDSVGLLPDPLLTEIHDNRGALPETLEAALAFLRRGGIEPVDGALPAALLEETAGRVLGHIGGLVKAGHTAVAGQLDLLRELERERLDSLRKDVASGRDLNAIRKDWENLFLQRWQPLAEAADSPYAGLTKPALDALNKTLRQLYDTVLKEQMNEMVKTLERQAKAEPLSVPVTETASTAESPPEAEETAAARTDPAAQAAEDPAAAGDSGESAAAGGLSGTDGRPMPDVLLVLSDADADRCKAVMTVAGVQTPVELMLDAADAGAAADALFAAMEPHLGALLDSAMERAGAGRRRFHWGRRQADPGLSVHIVVEGNAVRHRTSLLLKRRIDAEITRLQGERGTGDSGMALQWEAGLEF
jgi:hypothetical protein